MTIGRVPGATGIQPTIVDAKGDLIAATAADSVTRLAVGSNNQVLMADSAQGTGLKYANEATATLTAKGDLLSATAANTLSRLAVGSNDQVLTADSSTATGLKWATPVSGSLTLLSTTSLSGATASVSSISTSYKQLQIHIYGVTNATADGTFRLAPNGTTNITRWNSEWGDSSGNNDRDNQSGLGYLFFSKAAYNLLSTDSNNYWVLNLYNYANTTYHKTFDLRGLYTSGTINGSAVGNFFAKGRIQTTSALTSLTFSNSAGNLSTGTVLVYGVN